MRKKRFNLKICYNEKTCTHILMLVENVKQSKFKFEIWRFIKEKFIKTKNLFLFDSFEYQL